MPMNKRSTLFAVFIIVFLNANAQHRHMYTDKIVLSLYTNSYLTETINDKPVSRFVTGLNYQVSITKYLEIIAGTVFNFIPVTDYNRKAADAFYGSGKFKELGFDLGANLNIGRTRKVPYYAFGQILGFYSTSNYSGNFSGGFSGQGLIFDNKFSKYGATITAGLAYDLPERGFISAAIGYSMGSYEERGTFSEEGIFRLFIPFEVKLGYYFGKSHFRKHGCNTM